MMAGLIPRRGPLSLAEQLVNLRRLHPTLKTRVAGALLTADGWIRGNTMTASYHVRVEYRREYHPRAFILDPPLERRHPKQPVAHTLGPNEPCLYTKGHRDWNSRMFIGQTIVPWLMEWLAFYELWRATGRWYGGGTLPHGYEELGWEREAQN